MKIFVILHKFAKLPDLPNIYEPLQVGAALNGRINANWRSDDSGDNISDKNLSYNELTGLYWIWKNYDDDIVGLCHYRRFFVNIQGKIKNLFGGKKEKFLSEKEILAALEKQDIIVHNKTFFLQKNSTQFKQTQKHPEDLLLLEKVLEKDFPDYIDAYHKMLNTRTCHLLNVMIAPKEKFDSYCEWLFCVLFKVENMIAAQGKEADFSRRLGMLGERLMDVWIIKNKVKVKECFMINTEKITWKAW